MLVCKKMDKVENWNVFIRDMVHCFTGKLVCMQNMIQIHQFFHKILGGHNLHIFRR